MAKAPSIAASFDGSGTVWFKVYELSALTDGGHSISWPAMNKPGYNFTIPQNLPIGDYLVRIENIALHTAKTFGGAQFFVSIPPQLVLL
jgi:Auxiliary Activity family 9 (formerly GH61)